MIQDLKAHVLDRLVETGVDNEEWSFLVLAALDGPDALDNYLGGRVQPQRTPRIPGEKSESAKAEPPGVYVSSITATRRPTSGELGPRTISSIVKAPMPTSSWKGRYIDKDQR